MNDITLQNFESDLIQASMQQPVLVDFWATWCGPCKSLGPILDKVEADYGGRFKLAKLNSDEQPEIAGQLSQAFGVRSIPFCVLFHQGQPVDGFVGAVPESQVREFLDRHVPSAEAMEAACAVDSVSPRCIDLTQAAVRAQSAFFDAGCDRYKPDRQTDMPDHGANCCRSCFPFHFPFQAKKP